jgi:phosphatidylinositol alpha-1,6-mannosyltransferase
MRTLLITTDYLPNSGGVANYYSNLIKHWPANESIWVLHRNYRCRAGKYFGWLMLIIKNYFVHRINYIIVGQLLPLGIIAWFFKKTFKIKYAVFIHGMDFAYALKTPRKATLTKKILLGADKLIIGNDYTAGLVRDFLPAVTMKSVVVNPGVSWPLGISSKEAVDLRKIFGLGKKIILFGLGRLVKRKGFDKVITALELLPKKIADNLVYVLAGDGEEMANLKILAGDKQNIIFLGRLSEAEKWAWLKASDIFIMTSRNLAGDFEGFGIVYLEANLCGKQVIAGRSGGVAEAVVDNLNGLLVDPEDEIDIAAKIAELASHKVLREKLGEAGKRRAVEFSWERQINKIYSSL